VSVTIVIGKRHVLAGLSMLVLTALIGVALVVPAVSDATTTYLTRTESCAGLDFYPTDSKTQYDNAGTLRVWRYTDIANPGTGIFRCDPGLPNGAIVKQVQATSFTWNGLGVITCALVRSGLTPQNAGQYQDVGRVTFPGGTASDYFRESTTSVQNATIDNTTWGYWLECALSTPYAWTGDPRLVTGLYGADVIYKITAAKG
jgi:hypothetical protein